MGYVGVVLGALVVTLVIVIAIVASDGDDPAVARDLADRIEVEARRREPHRATRS